MLCNPDCLIEWRNTPPPKFKKDYPGKFLRVPDFQRRGYTDWPGSHLPPDGSVCVCRSRYNDGSGAGAMKLALVWHCPACGREHEEQIPEVWIAEGKAGFVEPAGLADVSWAVGEHPPVIYLATSYTHELPEKRAARAALASQCAAWLMAHGWHVVSPVSMGHAIACDAGAAIAPDFSRWREVCLRMLEASDGLAVLLLDGIRESVGVAAEIDHARRLGLPCNQIKLAGPEAADAGQPFEIVPAPKWWR